MRKMLVASSLKTGNCFCLSLSKPRQCFPFLGIQWFCKPTRASKVSFGQGSECTRAAGEQHFQEAEGAGPAPLLRPHYWAPCSRGQGQHPGEGQEGEEGTGASLLSGRAERAGAVQPGEPSQYAEVLEGRCQVDRARLPSVAPQPGRASTAVTGQQAHNKRLSYLSRNSGRV